MCAVYFDYVPSPVFAYSEKESWKNRREDFNAFRVFNPGMISKKRISRAWLHEAHKLHRAKKFWK